MSGSVSVTAITSTPSGSSLDIGSTVAFALSASVAVQVTPASGGGQPALTLNNGGVAGYTGTDANGNLLFSYTVAAGENTSDLKVTGLNLNGATIASVGDVAFQPPVSSAVGSGPFGTTVADFNGDGKPDLVVGNGDGGTISVLLNDGQGGFGSPTNYSTGAGANAGYYIAVADVTGDGKPDLVTADNGGNTVSVLPGDGQGGFGAPTLYAAGLNANSVTAADLNGDGKPDLVAASQSGNTISVLLNNGQGGFDAPTSYTVGSHSDTVVATAADLNGDGKPDLVVPNRDDGTVSVLLNNGQGGFGPQATYAVGTTPVGGTATDINGDGKPDLVVGNESDNTVSVLLGNGDGTFGAQTPFAAGPGSDFISTADLNGDGKPDLAVSDYYGSAVSTFLNSSVAPGQALDASGLAALSGADTGDSVACYLRGTRLAMPGGEVAVEDLAIGDLVTTPNGPAPVRWIGRRSYSGRFARNNKAVLPVRVCAGALADGVPCRDLWVSPKHALLLDDVLIPAEVLVNGTTIVQEREVEMVEYVHVELDRHGILVAEGALAESFVDDNSRGMFHNAHEHAILYPDAPRGPALYCAPRREDGEQVEAVRRRLAQRADPAAPLGHEGFGVLRGSVDLVENGRVHGWAQHDARPEVPVCLELLLGGTVVAQVLADRYRPDLWQAGLGSGCHAFEMALPEAWRSHVHAHGTQALRVRRIADGAELPNAFRGAVGSPGQHGTERDCAA